MRQFSNDETAEEAALMRPFREQEQRAGVLSGNFSRLKIIDKNKPVILMIHDGATTVNELMPLAHELASVEMNFCFVNLPGHGCNTEQPDGLTDFTPARALKKIVDVYQHCCQHFSEVNLLGVSTGALLAMLLTGLSDLAKRPQHVILISPYVSQFWSNRLLLSVADILQCLSYSSCGGLDALIQLTTGHSVNLQRQTFLFQKHPKTDGHSTVPLALVKEEGKLMDHLAGLIAEHTLPKDCHVHAFINQADIYIPAAAAKSVVSAFYAESDCHIHEIDYPQHHCIIPELVKNGSILNCMRGALIGLKDELNRHAQSRDEQTLTY